MSTSIPVRLFHGGMTADPRDSAINCQLCKHFDNFTKNHSLIPYRSSSDAYASQATVKLQNFWMVGGTVYALGVTGTNRANIFSNTNISIPSWVSPTSGQGTLNTTANFDLFFEYRGVLWGTNNQGIWSYTIATTTFNETGQAISNVVGYTQGLVHSKDDIAYFGYNTLASGVAGAFIASKNGTNGWTLTALTLPTNLQVTGICEYGNFLAILCAPINLGGKSVVYLWDRDSSLSTLSESLSVGNRIGKIIETLDGYLVVVSASDDGSSFNPKIILSQYDGGATGFQVFDEIPVSTGSGFTIKYKQKVSNRLYFGVSATGFGSSTLYDFTGVWSVQKPGPSLPFSVIFTQLANNDTLPATGGFSILGFLIVQDYYYISYISNSVYGLSLTNNAYLATSVYRTMINPNMGLNRYTIHDPLLKKKLEAVMLSYGSFPSGGQVVFKYRVDGGAWTTVFTETTQNAQFTEVTSASGTSFTQGRDYEFEFDSTGGVEITGLMYKYDTIPTNI